MTIPHVVITISIIVQNDMHRDIAESLLSSLHGNVGLK